jgi:hypothetical protein
MDHNNTSWWKKSIFIVFLGAILWLTLSGRLTEITDALTRSLATYNQNYLDESLKDTMHLMIPLGIAKAGADIIEGSTTQMEANLLVASANMNIEAGDALQPILEYINVAWKLLLLSMVYLLSAKTILMGTNAVAQPFLVICVTAYLLDTLAGMVLHSENPTRQVLKKVGPMFLLCALMVMAILPLTVYGAAYLSRHTTMVLGQDMWSSFEKMGEVFSMDEFQNAEGLTEKTTALKNEVARIADYSRTALGDITLSVGKLAVIKILNGIVYPLASFLFLVWIVRGCLYPALGLGPRGTTDDDLRRLAGWLSKANQLQKSHVAASGNTLIR